MTEPNANETALTEVDEPVLLFDGVCNLCNSTVQFVVDRDPDGRVRFASLQSEIGAAYRARYGFSESLDSVVLIQGGRAYQRSGAALRLAWHMRGPWKLLAGFLVVPAFLRDVVYGLIARNRYRWFGKEESCRIPTPELRERFLGEYGG